MGEVWIGKHRVTGGISAVKILHPDVAARERAQRFFARERRAIARLAHPHIVALHDLGDGYIATAYIDGADLSRRMQTPILPRAAVRYTLQIASALEHAHACGVVHRDVKPSNILVDRRGNAYLTDFGLAALVDEDASQERAGTPAFMPPEQARGYAGPAADQFALARTLATVLAGVSVSGEGDPLAMLEATPRALVEVLRRATSPEPAARFSSMVTFAEALAAVDLGDAEVPMLLAPENRVRAPFAWATGAYATSAITHEIRRADYRLSDLARSGLVDADASAALGASSGYEELAWSVYAHEGRLGPVASDGALARASDLVVILHGFLGCRRDWHEAAVAMCRDNAQAVVLVPDLFGAGDSRLLPKKSAAKGTTLDGTMASVLQWLDLLHVRDLPTVILGHSFCGAALLGASDDQLGERVTRIAVTPGLPATMSASAVAMTRTMSALARVPALRPVMARFLRHTPDFALLDDETCHRFEHEFLRAPSWLLAQAAEEQLRSTLAPAASLRRCAVLVSEDDYFYPARLLEPYLTAHGIPREFIQRLVECGHYPQLENREHPEAKAHNVEQITRCVDAMLTASREGAPLSTMMASTVLGGVTAESLDRRAV
jgi:serine/threonine-protein kinase